MAATSRKSLPCSQATYASSEKYRALGVSGVLILGEDEVRDGTVMVRDMATSSQEALTVEAFITGVAIR